jgi:hypothetical protein
MFREIRRALRTRPQTPNVVAAAFVAGGAVPYYPIDPMVAGIGIGLGLLVWVTSSWILRRPDDTILETQDVLGLAFVAGMITPAAMAPFDRTTRTVAAPILLILVAAIGTWALEQRRRAR